MSKVSKCGMCGAHFVPGHNRQLYCGEECSRAAMRASWRKYARKNKAARSAYHKSLYKAQPEKTKARVKEYQNTPRGKAVKKAADQNQRKRNPEKVAARLAVSRAIVAGKLRKHPCEVCGSAKVEAHHPDYSKPLDVRWLCPPHHIELHNQEKE